ncbi:right-handed parallel beta-helix repeat-containing protein [Rudanella lutea]|uniref:right-handed parallel beta-helix repeat-containing protein n=1 Tax=Rudanella lutea TaxID=451374 RepID=UPI0012F7E4A0|nr:right-handed parallel beta-helix repeat-containing protein [Rudanella lutea]
MRITFLSCLIFGLFMNSVTQNALATDYYVHPTLGLDTNTGTSKASPIQSLAKASSLSLQPGDRLLLADGQTFAGSLRCRGWQGSVQQPIVIESVSWQNKPDFGPALIDAKNEAEGILLLDCSHVHVRNLSITANGYTTRNPEQAMRVGVLVTTEKARKVVDIRLEKLLITDIFYENPGVVRTAEEVKSPNGTQKYGWGIRLINQADATVMENIRIADCVVKNVSHTGIKLTGKNQNIQRVEITGNRVQRSGGPGIQMSGVKFVYVAGNEVKYSGSTDDGRKWGRGSGLWTWGASQVLIEKNSFLYANGPGDSAGAHIDYNCDNVVMQYNFSAHNAGGFCEILGNNYNCAYRYNISVDDGHRIKGENGAFQEGKIFWLSGYQGNQRERKGPVNSYFYNNTIYTSPGKVGRLAIDNGSEGVLIANNIFYVPAGLKSVQGDQLKPDESEGLGLERVLFTNNLYLKADCWPTDAIIQDRGALFGDPQFGKPGGLNPTDYLPKNRQVVRAKGIAIPYLPGDEFGLMQGLKMSKDFLGNPVPETPGLGAIEVGEME